MTLIELAVVLVVLGVVAGLVLPPFTAIERRPPTYLDVVRAARGAALARAQALQLTVAATGEWSVHPLPPADGDTVATGTLPATLSPTRAGAAPFRLHITPLGACLPMAPVPEAWRDWDAAACRPALDFAAPGAAARAPGEPPR